jgi:hypothetical protein
MGAQGRKLGLAQARHELAHDQAFQLDADVEGVARLLPARDRDDGDAGAR